APCSAFTLACNLAFVSASTTSPNFSANLAACSASSKAILFYASATSANPSLSACLDIAKYIPTSVHSPTKLACNPSIILSSTPLATPILCSSANAKSSPCSTNLSAPTPHTGHFSG